MVIFLCLSANANAQTKNYATILADQSNVTNAGLAHDGLLATRADVVAKTNTLVFPGYQGAIELQFPTTLPANTTTYIRIASDDNILAPLIGGNLGGLLSSVLGVLLTGNQEFSVDAKLDGGSPILTGNSTTPSQFATDRLRIVQSAATPAEYYIRITPNSPYNRIRLTNKIGNAVVGLGVEKKLYVYDAYYLTGVLSCGDPTYTSFSATSIVSLGDATVTNPQHAITSLTTDYSVLTMGALSVASTIEQTVYFDGLSSSTDTFGVRLSLPQSLLSANVLGGITVIASNGGTAVETYTLSQLIALNLLNLQPDQPITAYFAPNAAVDRITLRVTSVAAVAQNIHFYGVTRTLAAPVITGNNYVCYGSMASLVATTPLPGAQIKWYSTPAGGTPLVTTTSGQAAVSSALTVNTTFYVQLTYGACLSAMLPVTITVISTPAAGIITGEQTVCLTRTPMALSTTAYDSGVGITYKWEISADQAMWATIPDATSFTYQPPVLTKTTYYRRITIHTISGVACPSLPSNVIKVTTRNCMVISNPMVRQRIKSGV